MLQRLHVPPASFWAKAHRAKKRLKCLSPVSAGVWMLSPVDGRSQDPVHKSRPVVLPEEVTLASISIALMFQLPIALPALLFANTLGSICLLLIAVFGLLGLGDVLPVSESLTICSMTQIAILRSCGQCCLAHCTGYCNGLDELDAVLGCEANTCYCKSEVQPLALSHLSTCVEYYCSDKNEVTSWQNIYLSYCALTHGAQYPVSTAGSAPTTTANAVNGGTTVAAAPPTTVTLDPSTVVSTLRITLAPTLVSLTSASTYVITSANGVVATVTNSSVNVVPVVTVHGDSTTSSSGLSASDKIALGVGIDIGLPSFIAAVFFGCLQIRQHNSNANAHVHANMM